jgi:hypothetical protein
MSHKIVTSPANATRQYFRSQGIDLKVGQCSEVLASVSGFTTFGALAHAERSQSRNCDEMLSARWVLIDHYKVTRRLADFGISASADLLEGLCKCLTHFWEAKLHPRQSPLFGVALTDLFASNPANSAIHPLPSGYFIDPHGLQLPSKSIFWSGQLHPGSFDKVKLPHGQLAPNDEDQVRLAITLKFLDSEVGQLSPHNRAKFPDGVIGAYLYLYCVGPRGLDYGDIVMPDEIMNPNTDISGHSTTPHAAELPASPPQVPIVESSHSVAEDEPDDEDHWDDGEEDDGIIPEGELCENDSNLAVASTEYGYLCEDCYEHYCSGYIRD